MSTSGSGNADSGGVESTPTDIDDDVRADLEAAFSRDTGRLRIKDETSSHATGDATVDVVSPFEQPIEPSRDSPVEPVATSQRKGRFGRRRRRSILEIARDYDTRVKSRADGPAVDARIHEPDDAPRDVSPDDSPADPSSDGELPAVGGKKRVVITDDTVDAARESHDRRRAGRPRRRFWQRARSAEDDELSRLRKQRRAKQRLDGRWRPRWYVVVSAGVALLIGGLLLLSSPILAIKRVDVEGNVYTDPRLLADVIAELEGDPILTADLHGAQVRVEAIPWVRKARVSMHLPSRILIQVDERTPLAYVRSSDGFNRVIDRDGRVLDVIEGDPTDYVRINGIAPTLVAGDFVPQPFLGAAQLINALPVDLAERLVSASVSPEGEISLQFTPNLQVIFGAPSDYQAKLVGVINEIKRQGSRSYTVIDVSTGEPNVR
ncbi:MAG: cell division protein FtsQ/DivIB [Actinomycetota bacterium]